MEIEATHQDIELNFLRELNNFRFNILSQTKQTPHISHQTNDSPVTSILYRFQIKSLDVKSCLKKKAISLFFTL